MPTFQANDIDIDVEEFLDCCSVEELKEVIKYLKESGRMLGVLDARIKILSNPAGYNDLAQDKWVSALEKLADARLSMSNEECEQLLTLARKYGNY